MMRNSSNKEKPEKKKNIERSLKRQIETITNEKQLRFCYTEPT